MTSSKAQHDNGVCWGFTAVVFFFLVLISTMVSLTILLRHPASPFLYVTHASLNEINFTNGNTLRYDLDLNITARNPHKNYGIYYDDVRVAAYWSPVAALSYSDSWNPDNFDHRYSGNQQILEKKRFAMADLRSFHQGKKASTTLPLLSLRGQQLMILGVNHLSSNSSTTVVEHLSSNPNPNVTTVVAGVGVYDIVVELYFRNRFHKFSSPRMFKGGWVGNRKQESTFLCDLKVPLIGSPGTQASATSATFKTTQCVRRHSNSNILLYN